VALAGALGQRQYLAGMQRRALLLGAISAGIAVAAGAFGAHALKKRLDAEMLTVFETGARYHMYGALAAMGLALAAAHGLRTQGAGWMVIAGTSIFAGTLYALALSGVKVLGAITPLGGAAMIAAWIWVLVSAIRR